MKIYVLTEWEGSRKKFVERSVHKGMRILLNQKGGALWRHNEFSDIHRGPCQIIHFNINPKLAPELASQAKVKLSVCWRLRVQVDSSFSTYG